jgi:hypothetical protein
MRAPALALALTLAACSGTSGSSGRDRSPSTRSDAGPRPGADSGSAKLGATCEAGPGYAGPKTVTPFSHLSATVVDLDGHPAGKVTAQACGVNICLNGTTDVQGFIAIDQTANMTRPAFKYGGGQSYARFALPLGNEGSTAVVDVDLGEQRTAAFDSPEMGAPLTPGAQATSRGVTLTLAKSTAVTVDLFDYATPDLKKFRAAEIPIARAPAAVDAALGLALVVALTPAGTTFCPRAGLSVPNTPGWPAGSRVEFFLHGVEVTEEFAPYGGWAKVSGGAVSGDGATVETDATGAADGPAGLPILSVVGARLAR